MKIPWKYIRPGSRKLNPVFLTVLLCIGLVSGASADQR